MKRPPLANALVAGAGLSGMATAICLSRLGVRVDLVEIDPGWRPATGPVRIDAAALQAMEALGIDGAGLAAIREADGIDLRSASGALLAHDPAGMARDTRGALMLRPALARLLADATLAAGVEVRLGATVRSLRQDADGVEVEFSDTHGARYDLLVGADGVHSRLRELAWRGAPQPAFSGQALWHARLPRPPALARATIWQGGDLELALHPVAADEACLLLRQDGAPGPVPAAQVLPMLRGLLARFPAAPVRAIAAALDGRSQAACRALERIELGAPWHSGRVLLAGDAVHGTVGRYGVGGSRGMGDAVLLARELAGASSVAQALERFQHRRWNPCNAPRSDPY
ncbi:FAD-dependent monooxygenase [Massilia niastensis]|uniref:FAD-dependent monooxygenase n=1 Tax=Massilia niastensis TaxID=544911 RepID=UPI00035DD7A4|nr:FAD-dependent monooxygenase [Massilia niastensis]